MTARWRSVMAMSCRWTLLPTQALAPTVQRLAGRSGAAPGARLVRGRSPAAASPAAIPGGPVSVAGPAGARHPGAGLQDSGFNRTAAANRLGLSLRQIPLPHRAAGDRHALRR